MLKKICLLLSLIIIMLGAKCFAFTQSEARTLLIQSKTDYNGQNFLDVIQKKDNYLVSLFLDAGFDVNYISPKENTPLQYAALFNNIEAVKMLLNKTDININWKDISGKSAIDIAYLFGNDEIVDLLQKKGSEISVIKKNGLTDNQIQSALLVGQSAASEKKDIIFNERDTDFAHGGFLGAFIQTVGCAYFITPFCVVANENLTAIKKDVKIKPDKLNLLSNTYQVRIIVSLSNTNIQDLDDLSVIANQDGKLIFPYYLESRPYQVTTISQLIGSTTYTSFGFIANFYACDINPSKPIKIKVSSKASKELTFKFDNNNPSDFSKSGKSDEFKW